MVIREWRGRAHMADQDAYPMHFHSRVLPELRGIAGFVDATLGRRVLDGQVEFMVLTRWQSMDAIRAFAGDEPGRAVVEPGAISALTEFDRTVQHYEVVEAGLRPR